MEVKEAIEKRRSYRSLESMEVTEELIEDLARAASLAPSCYNNQPWRYVFIYGEKLDEFHFALASGNEWAKKAPLLVAIFSKKDYDCIAKDREYYLFDVGLSVENMMLRGLELGLTTHLMAGFEEEEAKKVLNIESDKKLISLMAVGKKAEKIDSDLSEEQKQTEKERPERMKISEFVYHNTVD